MGTSISQVGFTPDVLEPMAADLSDVKQSFSEFLKTISEQIKRAQRRLPSVREAVEGTAKVRFTIRRNGGVAGVKVVASSGSRALDAAAIAAVRDAAPFHSFPRGFEGRNAPRRNPNCLSVENGLMHKTLVRFKR